MPEGLACVVVGVLHTGAMSRPQACCQECALAGRTPAQRAAYHQARVQHMKAGGVPPVAGTPVFLHKVDHWGGIAESWYWGIGTVLLVVVLAACAWFVIF